jgi:hypothetical protein
MWANLIVITPLYSNTAYDRVEYGYNRQGQVIRKRDQNQTVHVYDQLGRRMQDRVVEVGTGVDGQIRRIGWTFDGRGRQSAITSYTQARPESDLVCDPGVARRSGTSQCPISHACSAAKASLRWRKGPRFAPPTGDISASQSPCWFGSTWLAREMVEVPRVARSIASA